MNISDYVYKTEMHAHSWPSSACSQIPPENVVKTYAGLGYTTVVLSNHFNPFMRDYDNKDEALKSYLRDYHTAVEYGKKYGIHIVLGCEIRFTENANDYLLFGIDEEFLTDAYDYITQGIDAFSKWFRNDKRVLVQAHPFRSGMTEVDPKLLDGIEVFNMHPNHNSRVAVAAQYARKNDFIMTCGTDYHHVTHEGMISLLTKKPITDSFELASVLKSRDYLFDMSGCVIIPYPPKA